MSNWLTNFFFLGPLIKLLEVLSIFSRLVPEENSVNSSLLEHLDSLIACTEYKLYIYVACLSDCLYPISVKTAKLIEPKFASILKIHQIFFIKSAKFWLVFILQCIQREHVHNKSLVYIYSYPKYRSFNAKI